MNNHITSDRCAWPSVSKQVGYGAASIENRERAKPMTDQARNAIAQSQPNSIGKVVAPTVFESFGSFSG